MSFAGDSLILTINGGSSSIKFALFDCGNPPRRQLAGQIEPVGSSNATLTIKPTDNRQPEKHPVDARDQRSAIDSLLHWLDDQVGTNALAAIGHRIVHGGPNYAQPERVSSQLLTALRGLSSIDPSHLPGEIELIEACSRRFPSLPQIACFDTAFHHDLPPVARRLPIPRRYDTAGMRRYGFHGLSYEYLIGELAKLDGGDAARGRIILAHLGNGASMAAVRDGKPIDTSMSFTPTAGLVMGSRSGDLDPGVLIHLMRSEKLSVQQIDDLVNRQSGMRGMSETTSDMRDLLALRAAGDARAAEAVASFCYAVRKYIGAFAAALGGSDTLVFAGGIGEHLPAVRREICQDLGFLGIELDADANTASNAVISTAKARVAVRVIPTDEEAVIAAAVCKLMSA